MKPLSLLFLSLLTLLGFVACSGENRRTPEYNPTVGPFDSKGNYIEAWADNPPTRKAGWFSQDKKPKDDPTPPPTLAPPQQVVQRQAVASAPRTQTRTVSAPARVPRPAASSKPAPKPVVKAKPKPAPPSTRSHRVVKNDTLYSLSRKYGTSVSAIQKANGLSGSTIRLGQTLKIPR